MTEGITGVALDGVTLWNRPELLHAIVCQLQNGVGGPPCGKAAGEAARVDQEDAALALDEGTVRVPEENRVGPILVSLLQMSIDAILDAIGMAMRHDDAPAANAQEALQRKQRAQIAVAAHSIKAYRRKGRTQSNDVRLAIPTVKHTRDLGMPAHRRPYAGGVTMRIGNDGNMLVSTSRTTDTP